MRTRNGRDWDLTGLLTECFIGHSFRYFINSSRNSTKKKKVI